MFNAWEGFASHASGGYTDIRFLRCAPGRTNPLYPGELCAPTLDDLNYESVSIDLAQLDRQGSGGIWVVDRWGMTAPFAQADPAVAEAKATERLVEFLAARIAGEGAEGYVDVYDDWPVVREVPLLYATTSGAPYERYEYERVDGPGWPYGGYITFSVRLFADGGATVVEQEIYSHWDGGRSAGIEGGLAMQRPTTTENGQTVPVPYYFFDDEVVAWVPGPWWSDYSADEQARFIDFSDGRRRPSRRAGLCTGHGAGRCRHTRPAGHRRSQLRDDCAGSRERRWSRSRVDRRRSRPRRRSLAGMSPCQWASGSMRLNQGYASACTSSTSRKVCRCRPWRSR